MEIFSWRNILIFTSICVKQSDAQCNLDSNGTYHFGPDCSFVCHCINNEQCDVTNGECPSGCDFEWVGAGCQYENIAVEQFSRHLDNKLQPNYADTANDRDLNTCSYTGNRETLRSRNPWWKIWFPYNFTMWKMEILTIDSHRQDFTGFKVIVEYVPVARHTDKSYYPDQTKICYEHNDTVPPFTSMIVTCDAFFTGNQIRIQLASNETQLVLCDVRIFGDCKPGEWGLDCKKVCGQCRNDHCDRYDGSCKEGCKPGYENTPLCDKECFNGKYGENCAESCSKNCQDVCDKSNGRCNTCKPGWTGGKCLIECQDGYYGNACLQKCSLNCDGGYSNCDKVFGSCLSGCKAGWTGRKCEEGCPKSSWGLNCANYCGHCQSKTCRSTDGVCDGLCAAGFKQTPHCDEECKNGSYGIDCSQTCSKNCQDVCSKENGVCYHCKSGWYGTMCTVECDAGRWGKNCNRSCSTCLSETCDRISGVCHGLCKPGFKQTQYCDEVLEETQKATGLHLSVGAIVGTLVAVILFVAVGSSIVTVLIVRRGRCIQMSKSRQKAEKVIVTELEEVDSAYETVRRSREDFHEYEMKGNY